MVLTLTITKMPPGQAPSVQTLDVGPMGCLIGRGGDNDWVLPDPERFLSSKHCQISAGANGYTITDTSTNGVFLNGAAEPLGRGMSTPLNDGDTFDLGDYRFSASLQGAGTLPESSADDPFGDPAQFNDQASPFADSPFGENDDFLSDGPSSGSATADNAALFGGGGEFDNASAALPSEDDGVLDPLAALDGVSGQGGAAAPPPLASDLPDALGLSGSPGAGSQAAGGDVLSDAAAWPSAKPDAGMLPDDWDDDMGLMGGAAKPQREPFALPDDDSLIVNKPKPAPKAPARSAPQRPATERPATERPSPTPRPSAKASPKPAARPTPKPAPTPPAAASSAEQQGPSSRHYVDTLGFEGQALSEEQIAHIEDMTAHMMRETLEGLMQILRSRSSIKNEFRMNVTTIQPVENNPLKFSANVDEVLEIMFLRNNNRSYKDPLDAVRESFQTIADHQVAVIAGIRSAFKSMMVRFDPSMLEEEFKQNGKGGLLPNMVSGKFWNAYQDHYQSVVNNMESSFQELFGDEFVQAYEDQLRKLSDARRRSN